VQNGISVAGNCLAVIDEVGINCSMPALYTNLSDVSRVFFIYFSGTGLNEYLQKVILTKKSAPQQSDTYFLTRKSIWG
jgi:hypothetical protein